jgi:hypothetical protein
VDRSTVQDWLDRYIEAWRSYERDAVAALFAERAEYRYHPGDDPIVGQDQIVSSWLEPDGDASSRDEPGTWDAQYEPYAVDGDRAVAVGWSRYYADASRSSVARYYDNCFLIEFDPDGRCRSFLEFFRQRPDAT